MNLAAEPVFRRITGWPPISRTKCAAFLVVLLLASSFCGCSKPQTEGVQEIWRFAIEETQGSVQDTYAKRFEELIEERTDGEVDVVVYPYGTLGTSDHILEQLHNGTLDFAMSSPGHLGKFIPEVQVFLLHFLMSDDEAVNVCALQKSEVRAFLDKLYLEKGLRFLSAISEGAMAWTTREAVRTPDDFDGMKFRVMTSPLLIAAYEAYGASPTPLPYSEVYSALQLRMIDGQVNPVFAIEEMSFYEVTDWLIFPGHAYFVTTVAGSPKFFEGLSPSRRELVEHVIKQLQGEIETIQQRFNRKRLESIEERKPEMNVVRLDEAQRARFREAAAPMRKKFIELAGERGGQLLRTLRTAVTECAARN